MRCSMLKGKIHRAVVTQAELHYEGSLTVDASLLEAADILPFEEIHVWNVTRGSRLVTYAMAGEPGSGTICVNGAGAHLVQPGDIIIVAAFVALKRKEARRHKPKIVLLDENNHIKKLVSAKKDPDGDAS